MSSPYVPDGCPLSPWEDEPWEDEPWEDEPDDLCPVCGGALVPGCPHADCRDWED